jgi:hypothetical protein
MQLRCLALPLHGLWSIAAARWTVVEHILSTGPTGPLRFGVTPVINLGFPSFSDLFLLLLPAAPSVAQTVGVTLNGPTHNGNL